FTRFLDCDNSSRSLRPRMLLIFNRATWSCYFLQQTVDCFRHKASYFVRVELVSLLQGQAENAQAQNAPHARLDTHCRTLFRIARKPKAVHHCSGCYPTSGWSGLLKSAAG